jgi:formate-dependent nitrite reductase membrane component NrfD
VSGAKTAASDAGYRAGPHPSPWEGPVAALDILLNNLGVGLFLVAAVGNVVAHDELAGVAAVGFVLAFAVIALDLLLLVSDLGDPFRFFHMLRVFKPRTPMSVGVWSLSALMIILLPVVAISVAGWFTDVPSGLETVSTVLATLAILPGLTAITYKGVLFSITAQPGWRDARWLGAYGCSSGPALGAAVLLLVATIRDDTAAVDGLKATTLGLLLLSVATLVMLRRDLGPEVLTRRTPAQRQRLYVGIVLTGLVIPVALLALGTSTLSVAVASFSVLLADFIVRLDFVSLPQTAPLADPQLGRP